MLYNIYKLNERNKEVDYLYKTINTETRNPHLGEYLKVDKVKRKIREIFDDSEFLTQ